MRPPMAAPTPMPALAPVERAGEGVFVGFELGDGRLLEVGLDVSWVVGVDVESVDIARIKSVAWKRICTPKAFT